MTFLPWYSKLNEAVYTLCHSVNLVSLRITGKIPVCTSQVSQSLYHPFQNGGIIPSLEMETNAALSMKLGPDLQKIIGSEIISVIQSEKGKRVVTVTIKAKGDQDGVRGTKTQQGFIQGIF